MSKLFVDKTIEINAAAEKVWDVLTKQEYTSKWAVEFAGGAEFYIESDWRQGSPVLWKDHDGNVIVEGNVTAARPNEFLRFTVFDTSGKRPPVTEEDGITYNISEHNSKTTLQVLQGDFSAMPEGEKFQQMTAQIWGRILPKVKELAEK